MCPLQCTNSVLIGPRKPCILRSFFSKILSVFDLNLKTNFSQQPPDKQILLCFTYLTSEKNVILSCWRDSRSILLEKAFLKKIVSTNFGKLIQIIRKVPLLKICSYYTVLSTNLTANLKEDCKVCLTSTVCSISVFNVSKWNRINKISFEIFVL